MVIVSSEFEELLGLADRIYIMRDGRTVGEVRPDGLDGDLLQLVLSKHAGSIRNRDHRRRLAS